MVVHSFIYEKESEIKAGKARKQSQSDYLDLPVLGDVEGPLELQVGVVVVVDELRHGVVVATSDHTRGGFLGVDWGVLETSIRLYACGGGGREK